MSSVRLQRVESQLKEEIGRLVLAQEIKDPRVTTMVVINGVKVSKDLEHAQVMVAGFLSGRKLQRAVAGLNSAAGFIQKRLGAKLRFRSTPKLRFVVDTSLEEGFRVTESLKKLSTEES
jgi:ribosome-binding factor A